MTTLLFAEHDNATLSPATNKALTAALKFGQDVDVLVAGGNCANVAAEAAKLQGVSKVLHCYADALAHQFAEPLADLVVSLAPDYDALVAPATANGKNTMPRIAALLDVMQVSDVVEVIDAETFRRPTYAGNAIQTVRSNDKKKVVTVRISAFAATEGRTGADAEIETRKTPVNAARSRIVEQTSSVSDRPDLASARVIVAGGRALGSQEKFTEVILRLADKLGGAVGASRAAVDAGYAPNDWQVGQTGKVVAPELYIACGISGAIQHLAGMKESRVIVAINKDEEAPIFEIADYGLVGDLFQILDEVHAELDRQPAKNG